MQRPLSLGVCSSTVRRSSMSQPIISIVRNATDQNDNITQGSGSQGTSSQTGLEETAEAVPADFGEDESPAVTTTETSSQDSEACSNSNSSASLHSADGERSSRKLK